MTRPKQRILSIHCWVLLSLDSLSASIASLNTLFIPPQQRSFTPKNPLIHLNLTENSPQNSSTPKTHNPNELQPNFQTFKPQKIQASTKLESAKKTMADQSEIGENVEEQRKPASPSGRGTRGNEVRRHGASNAEANSGR
ncbi:hypothetical protein TorRG33x02_303170 [Trema orientale]|uniref:Transmembrane protein n=1 Tax=Trema orientale TaxID=63057 RepID=A0A2P5BZL5_TREOI|nr:hypothetical protein TorRG33x02_303170 [Trema orientale]